MMLYIKIFKTIPPENIWQFKKYLNCQHTYNEIQLKDFNNNKYTIKNYDKFVTTNSIIHNLIFFIGFIFTLLVLLDYLIVRFI